MEFFSPSVQPLHPVIYATALVLLLCLVTVMATYVYHHRYPSPGLTPYSQPTAATTVSV